jgi:hypothetical protein
MSDLAGPADVMANVDSEDSYVRIQGPTNAGALEPRQAAAFRAHRGPGRAGSRRAREHERHAGGCRPDACGVARCPRSGQATRLRINSACFWRPISIWLMEEP